MKNLIVITDSGEFDLDQWNRSDRNYDLVRIQWNRPGAYNEGPLKNIYQYFKEYGLGDYDYYWFPDDDLEFKEQNAFFDYVASHKFDLCQPSLTADSIINHEFLRHQRSEFRKVPFVELMCPCFTRKALTELLWTFDLNHSGYGVDILWGEGIVIDRFQIRHSRPQQMTKIAKKMDWPDPQDELKKIEERYL